MARIIDSIKTGCSVKNVHILQFQNPLQTKFSLHISVCQSQILKKTFPETLYWQSLDKKIENLTQSRISFILNLHGTHYFLPKDENVVIVNLLSYGTAAKDSTLKTAGFYRDEPKSYKDNALVKKTNKSSVGIISTVSSFFPDFFHLKICNHLGLWQITPFLEASFCTARFVCSVFTQYSMIRSSTDYERPVKTFSIKIPSFWACVGNLGR